LLYWRGPVLSDFDGLAWRVGLPQLRRNMSVEAAGTPVDYEVTLEPHNRNWMFALEMPARIPPTARLTSEYLVISLTPIRSRVRDRKSTRLNSSHLGISYAVFCLKKKIIRISLKIIGLSNLQSVITSMTQKCI